MKQAVENFRSRDYWVVENAQYAEASFRLRKCAQIINGMAGNKECTLLDVGCGPAALQPLLKPTISYYGIDIAIHEPAAHLRELDTAREPIAFDNKRFDFVVALGFFEYMGYQQDRKFEEIRTILKDDGKFMMSYINFGHLGRKVWPNYNNVQPIAEMTRSLNEVFQVERRFPASHHWRQKQPGKSSFPALQMRVNFNIPIFSPLLAVEYFFICSRRKRAGS
ncbi:MAG: class I SAM-dependent methyltransferase [Candidatus Acidiferrum sp.]